MIAILLSAGKGTRMYPLTANTPKCLIDIGHGKTVLENQLDVLKKSGINKTYIIAGYKIEQIKAKISGYQINGMDVEVLHNPFYSNSNNIISLWLATLVVDEPCISINGDNLFKDNVIRKLMDEKGDIVMTIDRKKYYDADDMLIISEGENIVSVSKELDVDKANGESVGIIKYTKLGLDLIRKTLDEMLYDEKNQHKFYLSALQNIMSIGFPVNICEISQKDWAEIDYHPDVSDVRAKVDYFVGGLL